jgi:beta-glucosidase
MAWLEFAAQPEPAWAQDAVSPTESNALYKQPNAPIDRRVEDLISRMTQEEKVRQLDLYSGAMTLVDAHTDGTHAAAAAHFLPGKAQDMWGDLGVGAIHDLNPMPEQANAIQEWVLAHNRLGIPVLFIERDCTDLIPERCFPPRSTLRQRGIRELCKRQAQPSQLRRVRPG